MFTAVAALAASTALFAGVGSGAAPAPAPAPAPSHSTAAVSAPAVPGQAPGDIVMPPMPVDSTGTSGTVTFQLTNNTSQPVTFNVNVTPDAQNETTIGTSMPGYNYSVNPQVAPGQTVDVPITAGGGGRTDSSSPLVTVGLEGYAQFEMWVNVNTWTNSDFENIEYQGHWTGGGNTGGLSQVNLGNGSVISNGNGGINNNWTYVNGTAAGFVAN